MWTFKWRRKDPLSRGNLFLLSVHSLACLSSLTCVSVVYSTSPTDSLFPPQLLLLSFFFVSFFPLNQHRNEGKKVHLLYFFSTHKKFQLKCVSCFTCCCDFNFSSNDLRAKCKVFLLLFPFANSCESEISQILLQLQTKFFFSFKITSHTNVDVTFLRIK